MRIIYLVFALSISVFISCTDKEKKSQNDRAKSSIHPFIQKSNIVFQKDTIVTIKTEKKEWTAENNRLVMEDSWCYDTKSNECPEAGRLYRWQSAVVSCQALGAGWRLPTDEDWKELAMLFGGYYDFASSKEFGEPKKANKTLGVDGVSGFNAFRNGWRGSNGGYSDQGNLGFYWSGTELENDEALFYIFYRKGGKLTRRNMKKRMGMSVRCVRDNF